MDKMMKGYLIDAAKREITPFEYLSYRDMLKYLPGGICTGMRYSNGDTVFVDDEALLRKATVAFRFKEHSPHGQPMMSHGIVVGRDMMDGEGNEWTAPPASTMAEIAAGIEWLDVETALNWFRERRYHPSSTLTTDDGHVEVLAVYDDFLNDLEGGGADPEHREEGGQ